MYHIKKWFAFYSSQIDFFYQAGRKLQKLENASIKLPDILLFVPWKHQTVIVSIETKLYEHTGKALNNFAVTLPQPQNELASKMLKDPYKFDFISMKDKFDERDLENKLARNITRFLLELGKGFAYVGRQMELDTPSGQSYFSDMVFYHTRLK